MVKTPKKPHIFMPHNPSIQQMIDEIGKAMEAHAIQFQTQMAKTTSLMFPLPDLKDGNGYNKSLIVETAVNTMAWKIRAINREALKRYEDFYLDNRSLAQNAKASRKDTSMAGQVHVYLSAHAREGAEAIAHSLKANGIKGAILVNQADNNRGPKGKETVNYRQIIIMALCYARDIVAEHAK